MYSEKLPDSLGIILGIHSSTIVQTKDQRIPFGILREKSVGFVKEWVYLRLHPLPHI